MYRKGGRKKWTGCSEPIMKNAELDFLLLLMGIFEEYQSELTLKNTLYEKFQAHRYRENSILNPSHSFNNVVL